MRVAAFVSLLALLFSGCIQHIALSSLGGIMDSGFDVLNEEQDLGIAEKSIASNLILLETLLRKDPDNLHYAFLASEGYTSYTLGFVEDDSVERANVLYRRAMEYGLRVLRHHREFAAAETMSAGEMRSVLASFTKDDVPAVFWTALAWGSWIRTDLGNAKALADLPKVEAMMEFVAETDPGYFYGGGDLFLGTLEGSRPRALGGDPEASRRHFEKSLGASGGKFLMEYVYYARSYAVQTQDRELFDRCLTTVDTTSINVLPAARLSNAIAKKKAKLLRAKADEYF